MGKRLNPRHGSMQFWPRVRASRQYARVRGLPKTDAGLLAFAGYKAGMTHVLATDNNKNSLTKGEKISLPVTVIECPPIRILSVRLYTPKGYGQEIKQELFFKTEKEVARKAKPPKKLSTPTDLEKVDLDKVNEITAVVYTQPKLSGVGKKTPEIFELGLGGNIDDAIAFLKDNVGKDIIVGDVLSEGAFVDARAVTKGKGTQGPVKRFGVSIRAKKSEKTKRGPGSLGAWIAQGHTMYRMAFAGQTGYHQRTQYNNRILAIMQEPEKVNPKGGFVNYGAVKSTYVLVNGSVPGPKKRLVTLTKPLRTVKQRAAPTVNFISTESKQGN